MISRPPLTRMTKAPLSSDKRWWQRQMVTLRLFARVVSPQEDDRGLKPDVRNQRKCGIDACFHSPTPEGQYKEARVQSRKQAKNKSGSLRNYTIDINHSYTFAIILTFASMTLNLLSTTTEGKDKVCLNIAHSGLFSKGHLLINNIHAYRTEFREDVPIDQIQIGQNIKVALFGMQDCESVTVKQCQTGQIQTLREVDIVIALACGPKISQVKVEDLESCLKQMNYLANQGSYLTLEFRGVSLDLNFRLQDSLPYGFIERQTIVRFKKAPHQKFQLIDDGKDSNKPFVGSYESKMKNLKVGGHHSQLELIDRRVFATRQLSPEMMRVMGLKHIKGMLLHGPPGTGKTLIARQISKLLKIEPKIVNGPEIISDFVGKSEEKIRELFADAVRQQAEKGAKSELHCIIFDEIDALCKKRGSQSSNGVYDLLVNQLLTCIDGINELNNILVIGITNRKDLIDEAILRPGRLEVHIEVNIPDQAGRLEILNIHTQLMRTNQFLADSVNLEAIASMTKNYTGAELEGVIKSAQSFAIESWKRHPECLQDRKMCKVTQQQLLKGVSEVVPQFGKDNKVLEALLPPRRITIPKYQALQAHLLHAISNIGDGKHALLIRGQVGVGKTVIAADCALQAQYPYTRMISTDNFLGFSEGQIISEVVRIFEDAEKCTKSFIIIDDLLRLVDFVVLGTHYNTSLLNLLVNCLKKKLDPKKKMIIVATVGVEKEFKDLGLGKYFKYTYTMDSLSSPQIHEVLRQCEFEEEAARSVSSVIAGGSLSRIVATTTIEGTRNAESWLRCWERASGQNEE